ncbi:MAG TPA: tetratricopeptide repeat protein [Anaerolineales bacterium]|nr:tetratricopeptide repeat protein [Anaerolineales bacterium]
MKQRHQVFAQLTRALSRVYFDLERASGVAKDAGLDPAVIRHDPTPLNYWRNILEQAERQRAVEALLDVAEREYPKEERLHAARAAYQDWVKAGRPETPMVEDIQGERIDARESRGFIYKPSGPVTQYFGTIPEQHKDSTPLTSLAAQGYQPPEAPKPEELPEPGALPPGSRMPFPRNAVFTGRTEDLKELAECLLPEEQGGSVVQAAVATGVGGIGKTQLVVEFCYRYGRYFHGVNWIQADQDIPAEIAACGAEMTLQTWPETLREQVQVTLIEWKRGGPRLVVWDNIEDEALVQEWLIKLGNVRLLLTSRRQEWPKDMLSTLPLDTLVRPESLALLRKLAPRLAKVPDGELDPVAERLGDLPLALDLAGRYLHERRTLSPAGFLQELDEVGGALLHSALKDWTRHNPTRHETSLAATFLKSWERLKSEGAKQLFRACSYCAANTPIPWEVFYRFTGAEAGQGQAASQSQAGVDRQLSALNDLGLVKLAEGGAVMHPLLAEFARLQDRQAEASALPGLVEALGTLSFDAKESGLPERFKPLRAHNQAAAQWAEQAGVEGAGTLWNNLGSHLQEVAEYAGARQAFERALALDEAAFGPDHSTVAKDVNNLGGVLRIMGDLAGAKQAHERALRIGEATLGHGHPTVAIRVNNLGLVLRDLGDLVGARQAFERALAIWEKASGKEDPKIATGFNNLGLVLHDLGDLAGARRAYERALAIDEAAFRSNHPKVAVHLNNLGMVLRDLGDLAGARQAFGRSLAIAESAYSRDNPTVATYVNNLGLVLRDLGDPAEARQAFE